MEVENIDIIGGTFEDSGPGSDPCYNRYDKRSRERVVDLLLVNVPCPTILLDLGCSIGAWAAYFMQHKGVPRVIGVDISHDRLKTAKQRFYETVCADGVNLPLETESVDAVVCIDVLVHILQEERRQALLEEVYRVLKPEGMCLFSVASKRGFLARGAGPSVVRGHCVLVTLDHIVGQARNAGLQIDEVRGLQYLESLFPLSVLPKCIRYELLYPLLDTVLDNTRFKQFGRVLFIRAFKRA